MLSGLLFVQTKVDLTEKQMDCRTTIAVFCIQLGNPYFEMMGTFLTPWATLHVCILHKIDVSFAVAIRIRYSCFGPYLFARLSSTFYK